MIKALEVVERLEGGVRTHIREFTNAPIVDSKSIQEFLFRGPRGSSKGLKFFKTITCKNFDRERFFYIIKVIKEIDKEVIKNDITVIHAHSTFSALFVVFFQLRYDRHRNISYIYTPHAYYSEKPMSSTKRKIVQLVERWMIRKFDFVIHVSKQEQRFAEMHKLCPTSKMSIVANGLHDFLSLETSTLQNNHRFKICMVARAEAQKNPDRFITIAETAIRLDPTLSFVFVGDGELLTKLREKVKSIPQISFPGFSNDVTSYLSESSLFFSTSLYEGMPYSVLEAMRAGLPLLLSDVVGHKELIDHDLNGILFSLNDDDMDIAQLIVSLAHDYNRLSAMGRNSRLIFLSQYTAIRMKKSIRQLYCKINNS